MKDIKKAKYVRVNDKYYSLCIILFVNMLIVANICATKLIQIGGLVFDGGAITFPITYILGDVISEIYGFKATKKAIKLGFMVSLLSTIIFLLVAKAPPAPSYQGQAAFMSVLGFVPRIVVASLVGYLFGEGLNSYVLVSIKNRWGEKRLWIRLISSTIVGELADTVIFCFIAFAGVISTAEFINYVVIGYIYKVLVEVCLLPITYKAIEYIKKNEPSYNED